MKGNVVRIQNIRKVAKVKKCYDAVFARESIMDYSFKHQNKSLIQQQNIGIVQMSNYQYQFQTKSYTNSTSSFSPAGTALKSMDTSSNVGPTEKDDTMSDLAWATHLLVTYGEYLVLTANKIIVNNLSQVSAILVYPNFQFYGKELARHLNQKQFGIAKQIKSIEQVEQTFRSHNNITKVFVLFPGYSQLASSHFVPNFVNLILNFTKTDLSQYKMRIRKKGSQNNSANSGVVINLFSSEGQAQNFSSILAGSNIKSQILHVDQLKQLSQYCRIEQAQTKRYVYSPATQVQMKTERSSTLSIPVDSNRSKETNWPTTPQQARTNYQITSPTILNKSVEETPKTGEAQANRHESGNYGWATFLQAKISDGSRAEQCAKFINANKYKFHSCVIYTLNMNKGNQIISRLDEDLKKYTSMVQVSQRKPLNKEYFSALQNRSLRVLIAYSDKNSSIGNWILPYNVDFIINEELSNTDANNSSRLLRQRNDSVQYRGVVLSFVLYTNETQALARLRSLTKVNVGTVSPNNYQLQHLFEQKRLNILPPSPYKQQVKLPTIKQASGLQDINNVLRMGTNPPISSQLQQKTKQADSSNFVYDDKKRPMSFSANQTLIRHSLQENSTKRMQTEIGLKQPITNENIGLKTQKLSDISKQSMDTKSHSRDSISSLTIQQSNILEKLKGFKEIWEQMLTEKVVEINNNLKNQMQKVNQSVENNHNVMLRYVSQHIPDKIQQSTETILKTKADNERTSYQSGPSSSPIAENTDKINMEMSQKIQLINEKRERLQKQQQNSLRAINEKLVIRGQSTTEREMEKTIAELKLQNQKNIQQIRQLQQSKIQAIKMDKESAQLKNELNKQKIKALQLTTQIERMNKWKQQNQNTMESLRNRLTQQEQAKNQLEKQLTFLRAQLFNAKDEIIRIAGQWTSTQTQTINFQDIQKMSLSEVIQKYLNFEKKDSERKQMDKKQALRKQAERKQAEMKQLGKKQMQKNNQRLKTVFEKILNKTITKEDKQILSESQQVRQMKDSLAQICRNLQQSNVLVYFNKVIIKLIEHCDAVKLHQINTARYCQQLENSLASISEKLVATFEKGVNCSVDIVFDCNQKESAVNSFIINICHHINSFTGFCYQKIQEMQVLKKVTQIQEGQIKRLKENLRNKEQDFPPSRTIGGSSQTLQKLRKQVADKTLLFSTNQQNYLKTINDLNQELQTSKQSLQRVKKDLDSEKRNFVNTVNQSAQQLNRVRKNATEGMNRLRDQIARLEKRPINVQNRNIQYKGQVSYQQPQVISVSPNQDKAIIDRAVSQAIKQQSLKSQLELEEAKKSLIAKHQFQLSQTIKSLTAKNLLQISEAIKSSDLKHQRQIAQMKTKFQTEKIALINSHNATIAQIRSQPRSIQISTNLQEEKLKRFFQSLNSVLKRLISLEFGISLENYQRNLALFQNSFNEKYGRILFMPESPMFKAMKPEDKKFIYDNIVRATNKRISHTETLYTFHNTVGDTWAKWRERILDRPNLLAILTLTNGWKIGAFSENPYSQTDKWQSGKGYLMSITNKRCYDVKKLYEGKVARFAPFAIIFGNNELIIQDTQNFSILMNKMNLHFVTNGDRSIDFIGMKETEEGEFTEIQFHQVVFQ